MKKRFKRMNQMERLKWQVIGVFTSGTLFMVFFILGLMMSNK